VFEVREVHQVLSRRHFGPGFTGIALFQQPISGAAAELGIHVSIQHSAWKNRQNQKVKDIENINA